MGDSYKLALDGTTTGNLYGLAWSHPNAGGTAGNLNTHGLLVLENGGFLAAVSGSIRSRDDMRSPIFYDSNDTGYYTDPNNVSRLNYAIPNRIKLVNNVNNEPRWDFTAYVVEAQHWYGNNSSMSMYMGEGNPIWTYNLRSNIYYDRDNTGYYCDPNGTSRMGTINADSLYSYGNVTAYSDESLKKDWEELPKDYVEQLAKVLSGKYTRIDINERQAGVGANSFKTILPEVIRMSNGYMGVDYGNAALVSAVELAKRVVEQDTRIARLEELISKLIDN
jgi:hypothetical protein